MRKFIVGMLAGAMMFSAGSTALAGEAAWMTPSDVSVGWLQPGMSMDEVRAIYGPMKETSTHYDKKALGYGDSVKIIPTKDGSAVKSILVNENNGWATPAGITVGMDISVVTKIYGDGTVNPTRHKSHHMHGYDYYTYFPGSNHTIYLTFAAKNGKVAYIKAGTMRR